MMTVLILVGVLVPVVMAVVVVIVVVALTGPGRPTQPGWQPPPPVPAGVPAGVPGSGTWNAQVMGEGVFGAMGGSLGATFGRFELADGMLAFVPDGAPAPAWRVPCHQLSATHHGLFSTAGVTLRGPMGEVRCDVSVEHINRFTANSAKDLRESRHASQFVEALRAHGAYVA